MRRCRINLYPVGIEARTKIPCMGLSLSRGDFLSFPLFLFLQFFCSAPAEPFFRPGRSFRAPARGAAVKDRPRLRGHRVSGA